MKVKLIFDVSPEVAQKVEELFLRMNPASEDEFWKTILTMKLPTPESEIVFSDIVGKGKTGEEASPDPSPDGPAIGVTQYVMECLADIKQGTVGDIIAWIKQAHPTFLVSDKPVRNVIFRYLGTGTVKRLARGVYAMNQPAPAKPELQIATKVAGEKVVYLDDNASICPQCGEKTVRCSEVPNGSRITLIYKCFNKLCNHSWRE